MLNIEEMNAAFKTIEKTRADGLITFEALWELKAEVVAEFEEYLCYKYGKGFNEAQLKEMLKFASENAYGGHYEDDEEKFIEVVAFCRNMMMLND